MVGHDRRSGREGREDARRVGRDGAPDTHRRSQIVTPGPAARPASRSTRSRSRAPRATSACCRATRRCWPRSRSASCGTARGRRRSICRSPSASAEVLPDRVTILAQLAERAEDIDVARAEAAKRRAEERLAQAKSDIDYERARVALMKSLVRLQVSRRVPGRRPRRTATADARRRRPERPLMTLSLGRPHGSRSPANAATKTATATRADLGLFVVADGMGGHVAGEVASRVAVEAIETFIDETAGADKNRTWPFPVRARHQPRRQPPEGRVPARQPPDRQRDGRLAGSARHGDDGVGGAGRAATRASVGARRRQPRLRAARRHARADHRTITRGSKSRCAPAR